jgi:hypothetical protein
MWLFPDSFIVPSFGWVAADSGPPLYISHNQDPGKTKNADIHISRKRFDTTCAPIEKVNSFLTLAAHFNRFGCVKVPTRAKEGIP